MAAASSSAHAGASGAALPARATGELWDHLAAELAELASLARQQQSPEEFYSELLRRSAAALAAEGGAVWAPGSGGRMKQLAVIAPEGRPTETEDRQSHEQLLQCVAALREPKNFAANSTQGDTGPRNDSPYTLVVAPVITPHTDEEQPPAALIELSLRAGLSPAAYQGAQDYLVAASDIAAEFHALGDLTRLRELCEEQRRLLTLSERVHLPNHLSVTSATIASESRSAIGCDRVSVLETRGRGCRLLATSGVDRPNRRSRTVRYLEKLAGVSRRLGDPLYLADDQQDELPQAAKALESYADESHARQVAVVPMRMAGQSEQDAEEIIGVLVAENFDGSTVALARDRVTEAVRVCTPALSHAQQLSAIPLAGLQQSLGAVTRPSTLVKILLTLAALVGIGVALVFVPAELKIEARGQLQPVARRNVFAPGDGIIEQLMVEHGQQVTQGQVLATMHDPELDLEIKRADGQRRTLVRQLDAIQATRSSLDARESAAADAYRLSAEEQQLRQQLVSLDDQRALLEQQHEQLTLHSPQDGMVVTWQLEENLLGRPVQRGQLLLAVAEIDSQWKIELDLPDDRIGYLLDAQKASNGEPIVVEYRLGSQEQGFACGKVTRIAQRAEMPEASTTPGAARTVKVDVTPEGPIATEREGEVRPGASVRARVLCGEHSLGYVWMHDLINAARVWWEF